MDWPSQSPNINFIENVWIVMQIKPWEKHVFIFTDNTIMLWITCHLNCFFCNIVWLSVVLTAFLQRSNVFSLFLKICFLSTSWKSAITMDTAHFEFSIILIEIEEIIYFIFSSRDGNAVGLCSYCFYLKWAMMRRYRKCFRDVMNNSYKKWKHIV